MSRTPNPLLSVRARRIAALLVGIGGVAIQASIHLHGAGWSILGGIGFAVVLLLLPTQFYDIYKRVRERRRQTHHGAAVDE